MRESLFRGASTLAATFTLVLFARTSSAQITNVFSSDVEGFFGTQSDAFQQSEGPTNPPPWPANAPGPYPLTGPPTVPPLFLGFPNPTLPVTQNIAYAAPGHVFAGFIDPQGTTAGYSLIGGFAGGAFTSDAYAIVLGPPISLVQPAAATGFAYEQVSFAMDYSIGPAGILGGPVPSHPFLVSGTVLPGPGAYAQFGAQVTYWWIPVIPGTLIPSGPSINLGSLHYSFLQPGGGSFSTFVTQAPTSLLGASGTGFLEITGDMFVAGDPLEINVTLGVDTDGDGIPDSSDNCPNTPNGPLLGTCLGDFPQGQATCHANSDCTSGKCSLNQEDTGGIGTGSPPDGIGDACQCGDVNNDGIVNNNDATLIKRAVATIAPYPGGVTTLPGYHKCQVVNGSPPGDTCNNTQASIIQRAVSGLAPGILQGCHAATTFP